MVRLYLRGKYSLADFEESFIAYIKGEDYALTFSAQHVPLSMFRSEPRLQALASLGVAIRLLALARALNLATHSIVGII
jgi:hypothetical protein